MRVAWVILFLLLPFQASALELEQYRKHGVTITASPCWEPYSFENAKGQPDGFLIDYWKMWSTKTGIPVRFQMVPWKETIAQVAHGESDIQSGLYINDERSAFLNFSKPLYRSKGVLVIKKEKHRSCATVYEEPVGAIFGSFEEYTLGKLYPDTEIRPYLTSQAMLDAFVEGAIGAVVADYPTLLALGGNMGIVQDIEICETIYERDMHAGILKSNTELLEAVEYGLLMISGVERRSIINRWFVVPSESEGWFKRTVYGLAALFVLGGIWYIFSTYRKRS